MNDFYKKVYEIVESIPYGKVFAYSQIARALGLPRGARQVGWAMRHCPADLPWQRVVKADGTVAGGTHADIRKGMLEAEGVVFLEDGRVDMEKCGFDFTGCKINI